MQEALRREELDPTDRLRADLELDSLTLLQLTIELDGLGSPDFLAYVDWDTATVESFYKQYLNAATPATQRPHVAE